MSSISSYASDYSNVNKIDPDLDAQIKEAVYKLLPDENFICQGNIKEKDDEIMQEN